MEVTNHLYLPRQPESRPDPGPVAAAGSGGGRAAGGAGRGAVRLRRLLPLCRRRRPVSVFNHPL